MHWVPAVLVAVALTLAVQRRYVGGGAAAHRPFCYAMRPCEGRSATTQGRPIEETASDRDRVSEGAVGDVTF